MIRVCDYGHPPVRLESATPCRACQRRRDAARPSPAARGYGAQHQAARRALVATLPVPCAYGCGAVLRVPGDMVAAHVRDGDPDAGWVASCKTCNERAKRSRSPSGGRG